MCYNYSGFFCKLKIATIFLELRNFTLVHNLLLKVGRKLQ